MIALQISVIAFNARIDRRLNNCSALREKGSVREVNFARYTSFYDGSGKTLGKDKNFCAWKTAKKSVSLC